MSLKLIIPRDPLIFRDGKPFTAVPGERAKSIPFPFPATVAGAVRTRKGTNANGGFDRTKIKSLLEDVSIRGPFLVELGVDKKVQWYFPAPADALQMSETEIHSLAPIEFDDGASDLESGLKLIGAKNSINEKPMQKPPLYWNWELLQAWLLNPDVQLSLSEATRGPQSETRTHVSIDKGTQTAESGALFQTSGFEFLKKSKKLSDVTQFALAIETEETLDDGVDSLGGERRVVYWESSNTSLPICDEKIKTQIKNDSHCRLMLVTPAFFDNKYPPEQHELENGYLPEHLKTKYNLELVAVALPRYQTISGWDYEKVAPKPTRRLVPAGSVYFIRFKEGADVGSFVDNFWLHSICEKDSQDQRDGFGIALLGTWDGVSRKFGGA